MSCTLPNGYKVRRVPAPHFVNGEPVRSFRDDLDHEILVTDDGNPDHLLEHAAEAVAEAVALTKQVEGTGDGIEVLNDPMPQCPLIPETPPRLPFGGRGGA